MYAANSNYLCRGSSAWLERWTHRGRKILFHHKISRDPGFESDPPKCPASALFAQ
jgi:hypothetical protein